MQKETGKKLGGKEKGKGIVFDEESGWNQMCLGRISLQRRAWVKRRTAKSNAKEPPIRTRISENYCAQNQMRSQLSGGPLDQIRSTHRSSENNCFAKHGEAFVTSSSLRRGAEIMEAYQVCD